VKADAMIKIHQTIRGFDGFFKVDEIQFSHSLHQGGHSPIISREVFQRGQAVVVLLYDRKSQQIALVEQCRVGALVWTDEASRNEAWLLEPVAGMIDDGETPRQAGVREAREETDVKNIESASLEYICQYYPTPGGCSEILHLYACEVAVNALPDFAGLEAEHEDIRIVKIPFTEAKNKLLSAQYNVSSTIICLQWLFFQKLAD